MCTHPHFAAHTSKAVGWSRIVNTAGYDIDICVLIPILQHMYYSAVFISEYSLASAAAIYCMILECRYASISQIGFVTDRLQVDNPIQQLRFAAFVDRLCNRISAAACTRVWINLMMMI
jgi:hypothetical protein